MKKILSLLSAIVITVVSFAGISNADSKKPIVIPTHNWSSQIVMAYVIGEFLKAWVTMLKYEYMLDSQAVYQAMELVM